MKAKQVCCEIARGSALGLGMIPGVSAGTMAIIVGIYDKLVDSIANLRKDFKNSWHVLWPLLIGIVVSSILVLIGVNYAYKYVPFIIACLFAGLVLGSFPVVSKEYKGQKWKASSYLLLIGGFILAAGIGVLSALSKIYWNFDFESAFIAGTWWTYLACLFVGFVAAIACVIPGISGSMILFIFGLYQPCIHIYIGETSLFHDHSRIGSGLLLTLCVFVGAVLGLVVAAKGMKKLLETHRFPTFVAVGGFIIGSVVSIFVNSDMVRDVNGKNIWIYDLSITPVWAYVVGAVLFVGAIVLFYYISKKTVNHEKESSIEK